MSEKFGSISPEEETRRNVLRLETMAKNLVILLEESKSDPDNFDDATHTRLIVEYIQWLESIYSNVDADQKVALDISRETLAVKDPYYVAALKLIEDKNI